MSGSVAMTLALWGLAHGWGETYHVDHAMVDPSNAAAHQTIARLPHSARRADRASDASHVRGTAVPLPFLRLSVSCGLGHHEFAREMVEGRRSEVRGRSFPAKNKKSKLNNGLRPWAAGQVIYLQSCYPASAIRRCSVILPVPISKIQTVTAPSPESQIGQTGSRHGTGKGLERLTPAQHNSLRRLRCLFVLKRYPTTPNSPPCRWVAAAWNALACPCPLTNGDNRSS
jgi:hypothetical protein